MASAADAGKGGRDHPGRSGGTGDVGIEAKLARRLHRALTAEGEELYLLLGDSAPEVLRTLLRNRSLHEEHLLALLRRRDLPEDLLRTVSHLDQVRHSRRLKVALVQNPATPGAVALPLLSHFFLFELVDLCYLPGVTPDQKIAAERTLIQRLPGVELGNKLTLARRATANVVGEILKEGDPRLVETCLGSPRLRELAVLQFLNGPRAKADTISMVARHPKWKMRPNLRLAILRNRRTPQVWFTLFLPGMRTPDLRSLLASRRLDPARKKLVAAELAKRSS